jgi:hypothetical protein
MTKTPNERRLYMNKSLQTSFAISLVLVSLSHADSFARQKVKKPVQSGSVTGTYKYVLNSLEVLELPEHKVRISFAGFWPNDRKRVETRNVGTFDETVPLSGNTATGTLELILPARRSPYSNGEDPVWRRSVHNHAGIPLAATTLSAQEANRGERRVRLQFGAGWDLRENDRLSKMTAQILFILRTSCVYQSLFGS